MSKLAFILPGGGAAACEQFGAIKTLMRAGIVPDVIYGTSAGALNAWGVSYAGLEEMERVWRSLKSLSDIFAANWWIQVPWKSGLKYPAPLRRHLEDLRLYGSGVAKIPFVVTVTELYDRQSLFVPHTDADALEMTIASARIPGLVEVYEKDGKAYGDGGVVVNLPLKQAILDGATVCVCLHCTPADRRKGDNWRVGNGLVNALRAYDLTSEEDYRSDRDIGTSAVPVFDVYTQANDISTLDFVAAKIAQGIDRGIVNAESIIPGLREVLRAQAP